MFQVTVNFVSDAKVADVRFMFDSKEKAEEFIQRYPLYLHGTDSSSFMLDEIDVNGWDLNMLKKTHNDKYEYMWFKYYPSTDQMVYGLSKDDRGESMTGIDVNHCFITYMPRTEKLIDNMINHQIVVKEYVIKRMSQFCERMAA